MDVEACCTPSKATVGMTAGTLPCHEVSAQAITECMHMQLVEIVMDLGRPPLARFPSGDLKLADDVISPADLDHAISKVFAHSHP
jgi:stage III sporulation protein SpoIIIAA